VTSSDRRIIGTAPQPENLIQAMRLLRKIRGRCYEEVIDDRLSIPEPLCGKRLTILNNGGISTTTKFFQPLFSMR
jgi:hypothetical protein